MAVDQARILLVEDEEADVLHFQRLCRKRGIRAEVTVATNGDAALRLLREQARAMPATARYLIVTDLNMPGLTGHELIEEVRNDARIANSVIFVVSTSDLADDIEKAYRQHVAGYIVKDAAGDRLEAGVAMLDYYLSAVTLH